MQHKKVGLLVFVLLVVGGACCIYLPGLTNALVFDDNRLTDGGVFGSYGGLLPLRQRLLSYGSFVWLSALPGVGWAGQRAFNVILHLGTVAAIYLLFRELLARTRFPDEFETDAGFTHSREAALRVGVALFALNPVAIYAVAYLIQRSIVMATFFAVVACWTFVRGLVSGRLAWYCIALLAYVCALLSKEHAVMTAAFAVPLYIFVKRPGWKQIGAIAAACLVLLGIAVFLLTQVYGSILGQVFDPTSRLFVRQLEAIQPGVGTHVFALSILNEAWLFFRYGFLWIVPNPQWMSIDVRPPFPLGFGAFPQVLGAIGYSILLVGATWLLLRQRGAFAFAALCLLFPLLLFLTEFVTVWVQDPFVLYRSYLWAIAIPGLIALPLVGLPSRLIYTGGFVVGALFTGLALERVLSFDNELSVWSDAADKIDLSAPPNTVGRWRPFLNRGAQYLDKSMYDSAQADFTAADRLGESQGAARFNIGMSLLQQHKYPEAIAAFNAAEAMGNRDFEVYYQKGEALYAQGRYADAYQSFSTALSSQAVLNDVKSNDMVRETIRLRRAESAVATQQYAVAIDDYHVLLAARPSSVRFQVGLAMALAGAGQSAKALPLFDKIIAERPNAQAFYGRSIARHYSGDTTGSLQDLDHAIVLDPHNPTYRALRTELSGKR
ncbi:tetratricopeptide repeat protein [Xylophilus sp. GW821-FHT01B05]